MNYNGMIRINQHKAVLQQLKDHQQCEKVWK